MTGKDARSVNPAWLSYRGRLGFSAVGIVLVMVVALVSRQIPLGTAQAQVPVAKKPAASPARSSSQGQAGATSRANPNNPASTRGTAVGGALSKASSKAINVADLKVMAVVNGQQITRAQLAQDCLLRYGEEVIES